MRASQSKPPQPNYHREAPSLTQELARTLRKSSYPGNQVRKPDLPSMGNTDCSLHHLSVQPSQSWDSSAQTNLPQVRVSVPAPHPVWSSELQVGNFCVSWLDSDKDDFFQVNFITDEYLSLSSLNVCVYVYDIIYTRTPTEPEVLCPV